MAIVNLAGLGLIALVIWWFWLYRPREVVLGDDAVVIVVENGTYKPSSLKLPPNRAVTLHFLRKDASPCTETVIFPDLEISETLVLDKTTLVQLPPLGKGEYAFNCQMQMYRGVLKVEEG